MWLSETLENRTQDLGPSEGMEESLPGPEWVLGYPQGMVAAVTLLDPGPHIWSGAWNLGLREPDSS